MAYTYLHAHTCMISRKQESTDELPRTYNRYICVYGTHIYLQIQTPINIYLMKEQTEHNICERERERKKTSQTRGRCHIFFYSDLTSLGGHHVTAWRHVNSTLRRTALAFHFAFSLLVKGQPLIDIVH